MSIFIVLEGIDGSGKSTVGRKILSDFRDMYLTREPTGSEAGRMAKRIAHQGTAPYFDLFLYLADRVHHTEKIRKKLGEGTDVVCDRYWGSTAAYQAAGSGIDLGYLVDIQRPFVLEPDITFLFDVDPGIALQRIRGREDTSKYEKLEFLKHVRSNYQALAREHGWEVIDACEDIDNVYSRVKKIIKKERGF